MDDASERRAGERSTMPRWPSAFVRWMPSNGMLRLRPELMDKGVIISRKRVARLMRRAHIRGVSRRRGFVVTARRDAWNAPAPDLMQLRFIADGQDRLWVADMRTSRRGPASSSCR